RSLRRHREPRAHLVVLREIFKARLAGIHHHLENRAREGERSFVQVGYGRACVASDVEGFVGCKEAADLLLEPAFADRLFSEMQGYGAACLEFPLLVDLHLGREHLASPAGSSRWTTRDSGLRCSSCAPS